VRKLLHILDKLQWKYLYFLVINGLPLLLLSTEAEFLARSCVLSAYSYSYCRSKSSARIFMHILVIEFALRVCTMSEPRTGRRCTCVFFCVSTMTVDVPAVDGSIYPRWSRPFRLCRLRICAVVHCADRGTCEHACAYRHSVCLSVVALWNFNEWLCPRRPLSVGVCY